MLLERGKIQLYVPVNWLTGYKYDERRHIRNNYQSFACDN